MVGEHRDEADAERVLALLERQRDLYRRLKDLAARQRQVVTAQEPERLLEVLAERQRHVEVLSCVNEELRPIRDRWPAIHARMTPGQQERATALVKDVQRTLAGILEGDEEDARLLSARMSTIRQEALGLAACSRANAAYGEAAGAGQAGGLLDQTDAAP